MRLIYPPLACALGLTLTLQALSAPTLAETPHLVIDSPTNSAVLEGAVIITFHTENLSIDPAFGPEAKKRIPVIGHLHIPVDDNQWLWVYTSKEPLILVGLAPGPHKVRLDLADPNHVVLESQTVNFTMAGEMTSQHKH
ncbi:DUF6130 family protein [Undibacterium sp. TJN19]|uniref:DUF6130 family protein n=1 Tax=Undibacterium sp. TJN19 TaxID=3413055 RepID=UPI003BF42712